MCQVSWFWVMVRVRAWSGVSFLSVMVALYSMGSVLGMRVMRVTRGAVQDWVSVQSSVWMGWFWVDRPVLSQFSVISSGSVWCSRGSGSGSGMLVSWIGGAVGLVPQPKGRVVASRVMWMRG